MKYFIIITIVFLSVAGCTTIEYDDGRFEQIDGQYINVEHIDSLKHDLTPMSQVYEWFGKPMHEENLGEGLLVSKYFSKRVRNSKKTSFFIINETYFQIHYQRLDIYSKSGMVTNYNYWTDEVIGKDIPIELKK
jgi:hypothetical protein